MSRVGIYIGNQEVVERYVGDKLVWRKKVNEEGWNIVKPFLFPMTKYQFPVPTKALLMESQNTYGNPPEVSVNDRYPTIIHSTAGEYKIFFVNDLNKNYLLNGVQITNTKKYVRRKGVKNILNVIL